MSNDEYTYEIKPVSNGYIIDKQIYHRRDDGMTDYKSVKTIRHDWTEVVEFLQSDPI